MTVGCVSTDPVKTLVFCASCVHVQDNRHFYPSLHFESAVVSGMACFVGLNSRFALERSLACAVVAVSKESCCLIFMKHDDVPLTKISIQSRFLQLTREFGSWVIYGTDNVGFWRNDYIL